MKFLLWKFLSDFTSNSRFMRSQKFAIFLKVADLCNSLKEQTDDKRGEFNQASKCTPYRFFVCFFKLVEGGMWDTEHSQSIYLFLCSRNCISRTKALFTAFHLSVFFVFFLFSSFF